MVSSAGTWIKYGDKKLICADFSLYDQKGVFNSVIFDKLHGITVFCILHEKHEADTK
jgi:hypothetical protein